MADLATLGLRVDSGEVEKGARSLDQLASAASAANAAVSKLASNRGAASAALAAAKAEQSYASAALAAARASETATRADIEAARAALTKAKASTAAANADYERINAAYAVAKAEHAEAAAALRAAQAANAANDNARRMGGSMSGLAAQFQDIGVTAAMGMNPMIIALQQGTQIAGQMEMAMASGASATGVFAQAFRSLLSPVSLVVIALTALAAAGLQVINWTQVVRGALRAVADGLEIIAPYAAGAAAALALLYAPALIGGVTQLIALLGRLAVQAVAIAVTMVAANPGMAFVLGMTAAVAAAVIFRDELTKIFGFDIVGAAQDGVNSVIGLFVGAYNAVRDTWSLLPAAFADIFTMAMNGAIDIVQNGINGIIGPINSLLSSVQLPTIATTNLQGFKGKPTGAASQVGNSIAGDMQAAQGVDYIGKAVTFVQNAASGAADKLRQLAGSIDLTGGSSKKAAKEAEKQAKAYQDIVRGAQQHIAASQLEASTIGMTTEQINAQKYAQDLLNKAANDHIKLSSAQTQELTALGQAMAAAEAATTRAKEAFDFAKDATKGFLSDLRQGLMNGASFWESFGNAAMNVLDKIIDKVEDQLVDALFSMGSGGSGAGGGFFGWLGSILGFASGGYTGNGATHKAAGIVHGQEFVVNAAATAQHRPLLEAINKGAPGYQSGGYVQPRFVAPAQSSNDNSPQRLHISLGVDVDDSGNLMPFVKSVSQDTVAQAAPAIISTSVSQANRSAPGAVAKFQNDRQGGDWRAA